MARAMEHSLLEDGERFKLCPAFGLGESRSLIAADRCLPSIPFQSCDRLLGSGPRRQAAWPAAFGGLTATSGSSARRCARSAPSSESLCSSISLTPSSRNTSLLCSPWNAGVPIGVSSSREKCQGRPGSLYSPQSDLVSSLIERISPIAILASSN